MSEEIYLVVAGFLLGCAAIFVYFRYNYGAYKWLKECVERDLKRHALRRKIEKENNVSIWGEVFEDE